MAAHAALWHTDSTKTYTGGLNTDITRLIASVLAFQWYVLAGHETSPKWSLLFCYVAAPTWKSCQANATEICLTFDVDAYQRKYGNPDDVEVVITIIGFPAQNSQISLSDTYTGALDQFRSGITLEYYSLSDGIQSRRQTIDVDRECGRPSALRLDECTANSTNLYLQFGEYKGSINTVLEIELDNGTVIESLSNMTEYNIPGDHVKKVVYYAVFSDGEQSLKGIQEKAACFGMLCYYM